jgi:transposase InsO family protein
MGSLAAIGRDEIWTLPTAVALTCVNGQHDFCTSLMGWLGELGAQNHRLVLRFLAEEVSPTTYAILDDFSLYIIAWKLCTTMKTEDVTATLEMALKASGCNRAAIVHKPRLLSDNGSSYTMSTSKR